MCSLDRRGDEIIRPTSSALTPTWINSDQQGAVVGSDGGEELLLRLRQGYGAAVTNKGTVMAPLLMAAAPDWLFGDLIDQRYVHCSLPFCL